MTAIAYTAEDYGNALAKLAEKDKALGGAQTRFALLAGVALLNGDKTVADIVEDACNQTGSRGKPTKDMPKGKANPNALKANGFSGIARVVGCFKRIADNDANDAVIMALRGFVGFIPNEEHYEAAKAEDERVVAALAADDADALAKAEKRFHNGYVNALYTDDNGNVVRPDSFAALEKAVNKAIADAKPKANNVTVSDDVDADAATDVSAAAAVIGADDMAKALLERMAELSDETLIALFDAAKADMARRTADETPIAAAA